MLPGFFQDITVLVIRAVCLCEGYFEEEDGHMRYGDDIRKCDSLCMCARRILREESALSISFVNVSVAIRVEELPWWESP